MKTSKKEDKNIRYFIDIDLKEQKILGWGCGQKDKLIIEKMRKSHHHRIFVTRGQYNKLEQKQLLLLSKTGNNN